jgi:haloacid dehalogenase-like hydrolase
MSFHCTNLTKVLIFATIVGMRVTALESVARAVLPKFYSADLHPETWHVFSAFGRRCVLTSNLRIMVEPFLKEYLGVDTVIGTEICTWRGWATGLVSQPGMLVEENKADALKKAFGERMPEIGLGSRKTDYPFMILCQVCLLVFLVRITIQGYVLSILMFHFWTIIFGNWKTAAALKIMDSS